MRMREGHCAALALGRTGDGEVHFTCTIYERRPEICRELARGSPQCDADRTAKQSTALPGVREMGGLALG